MKEKEKVAEQAEIAEIKRSKQRSPNYPAIGLEKALERAETVKQQAGRHYMPVIVAHGAWNYKTGAGDQIVAALKAFGLIETQGAKEKRQIRLTESAWRVLGNAPDRAERLKEAALKPEIHRQLWEKFKGALPSEDAILKNYLVWDRKFNDAFVGGFIAQFRGTIAYANLTSSDKVTADKQVSPETKDDLPMQEQQTFQKSAASQQHSQKTTELAFVLSRDSDAKVVIRGDVTQEAIVKLRRLLEISEDAFPTKAELAETETAAMQVSESEGPEKGASV